MTAKQEDIRVFKLVTGESVIATVSTDSEEGYGIEHPLQFIINPSPEGVSLAAIPWLTMAFDEKVKLNKIHVVTEYVPNEMFLDMYRAQVLVNVAQDADSSMAYSNKRRITTKDKKQFH